MGYAIAAAALKAGHKVTLITGPTSIRPPAGAKIVKIQSAAEMFYSAKKHFKNCDCLIMAAAVSDYTPSRIAKTKIKKSDQPMVIKLKPTADILQWAGKNKKNQIVVGFALEDKNIRANAEKKLKQKKLDMIIANTPAAIAAEKAVVQIKTPTQNWLKLTIATKPAIAKKIINLIEKSA